MQITMSTTTDFIDYYAVLELPSTASVEQIRKTTQDKIDFLFDTDSEASAIFKEVILLREIKDTLCDETRRSKYDAEYQVAMGS